MVLPGELEDPDAVAAMTDDEILGLLVDDYPDEEARRWVLDVVRGRVEYNGP